MNSKYLGNVYSGWKVVGVRSTSGGHAIFTLAKKRLFTINTLTLRDNELTKLEAKEKTLDEIIEAKADMVKKGINVDANVITTSKRFMNLFVRF